ncbi:MAG: ABC transporter substrate-binding protein, partial [Candidatus Diapherotrites archaeon]|nr:ABC transporter substrate-binding protein [Candidatus Diapherotrites archaeon]
EIAAIYMDDAAAKAFLDSFSKRFEALGGKIIASESFEKNATDVRTQIFKIKQANPQNVLILGFPAETGAVLKQSKEIGLDARFFEGFEVMSDPQVAQIAQDAVNGVYNIQTAAPSGALPGAFAADYSKAYGAAPPYYAAEGYDAVYLYKDAIKSGLSTERIKAALYATKDFTGASGTLSFDANGDVDKPFEIGQVVDLKLKRIKTT